MCFRSERLGLGRSETIVDRDLPDAVARTMAYAGGHYRGAVVSDIGGVLATHAVGG